MEKITVNEYISEETKQVSERIMRMIEEGKLRNHKLSNTVAVHHGTWKRGNWEITYVFSQPGTSIMQCFYVVRWIMNNIENTYANYEEIVSEFKRK